MSFPTRRTFLHTAVAAAIARQGVILIGDAFYPLPVGEDFLSDLLEISGWADSRAGPTPHPGSRMERSQVRSAAYRRR
jgi:hypothetical protein